jgi:hypothetical protein
MDTTKVAAVTTAAATDPLLSSEKEVSKAVSEPKNIPANKRGGARKYVLDDKRTAET